MKIKKFLSIVLGMIEQADLACSYSADEAYDFIIQLEEGLKEKGIEYLPNSLEEDRAGMIYLQVVNQKGEGIPAEVKFFPMDETDDLNSYNKVNGKIDLIRVQTDFNGELAIKLPADKKYLMEISKGSEYEIIKAEVLVEENQDIHKLAALTRIINLQDEKWYGGDLHHHSIYSSPVHGGTDPVVETVEEVLNSMQAMGLTYGALSDHHNTKNHEEWKATQSSEFTPILSKEISTTNGHVMALGVDEEVTYKIPTLEERSQEGLRNEFIRVTEEIKSLGGMPQINHPRDLSKAISFPPEFTDMIEIFETMEIWNGSNPMLKGTTNYRALQLWIELLNEGRYIPATTGSDTHNIRANDYNEILERLTWLIRECDKRTDIISVDMQQILKRVIPIYKQIIPLVEKWAEENLGTGGVRTYAYVPQELSQKNILEALRCGNSFLTNGPILIPSIEGKIPGQRIRKDNDYVDIQIKLIANTPLTHLCIYGEKGKMYTIELEWLGENKKVYDYSQKLEKVNLGEMKWIFFTAASDHTNLVITNSIFVERC